MRCSMHVTLMGAGELTKLRLPILLEHYDTEEEAIARLTREHAEER